MRSIVRFVLLVGFALAGPAALADALPGAVSKPLARLGVPRSAVAVYVHRLDETNPRIAFNADKALNPASVMKVVTTFAALETLGPAYTWRTEAWIDGQIHDGVLLGDLILKGYGDPYFTTEKLWQFVQGLRGRGLREIRGDLILDETFFAPPEVRRADFDRKPYRAYNALPHALSLNFQAAQITVLPDADHGRARVFTYPELANLRIENDIKLVDGPCKRRYRNPVLHIKRDGGGPKIQLEGQYASGCREIVYNYLAVEPEEQIAGAFQALWRQAGGTLQGQVREGAVPERAHLLLDQESRSLAEVVRGVNKYSNNLMCRHVLLTLGAETDAAPATPAKGRRAVQEWFDRRGIDSRGLMLDNGAGLSRDARITAQTLGQLLVEAWNSPRMPEFVASLPVIGVDGTMDDRLRRSPLKGKGHIKTGSLDNVSAMAGYVQDRSGRRWAVVFMANHKKISWRGNGVQDALLRWVYGGAS
ncbi:MAG: D-alanyl-D-alanine carboxypeptidase/D-alanyl-D-alanine endopeptidase [Gammaproteobacteria bacterium]